MKKQIKSSASWIVWVALGIGAVWMLVPAHLNMMTPRTGVALAPEPLITTATVIKVGVGAFIGGLGKKLGDWTGERITALFSKIKK